MSTFDDALTSLMLSHPFYSQLLMKLKHVPDDSIGTAAVSFDTLFYSPAFFAKLDDDEAVFVVVHEVQHCVMEHLSMMEYYHRSGIGPDGKEYDNSKMNRAMDYPINATLEKAGFKVPRKDIIEICLDKKYGPDMTAEEVYCKLPDKSSQQPLDGHLPGGGSGAGAGGDPLVLPVITPTDIMAAANHHKAVTGEMPPGIERLLDEIKKPKASPWAVLRNFVTSSLPGRDNTTWRRVNRRMAARGVFMPGTNAMGAGRIGIVCDTSGSIGKKMLNFFGGHMGAIIDDAMPKEVIVYWVDDKVHGSGRCKNGSQLRAYLAKGAKGGCGTDMPLGVEAALADGVDAVVVLTDGFTPFGEPSKKPVLWAITTPGMKAPHGTTIHISLK